MPPILSYLLNAAIVKVPKRYLGHHVQVCELCKAATAIRAHVFPGLKAQLLNCLSVPETDGFQLPIQFAHAQYRLVTVLARAAYCSILDRDLKIGCDCSIIENIYVSASMQKEHTHSCSENRAEWPSRWCMDQLVFEHQTEVLI